MLLLLLACGTPEPDTGSPPDTDTDTGTPDDTAPVPVDTGAWPSSGLPSCDEADTIDTAGSREDCAETLVWSRTCDRTTPGTLTRAGLLWSGTTAELDEIAGLSTLTITDATSWEALVAAWPGEDKPAVSVDFSENVVVILQDDVSSTCGLSIPSHGVYLRDESSPMVYARFSDSSGACAWSCDMVQQAVVVYAVPFDGSYPVECAEEINLCDAF